MKTIMAKNFQDLSSKKQFSWTTKVSNEKQQVAAEDPFLKASSNTNNTEDVKAENIKLSPLKHPEISTSKSSSLNTIHGNKIEKKLVQESATTRRKAVARLKSVLTSLGRNKGYFQQGLGTKVVGTLFGHKKGHVNFAFQKDPNSQPAFLVELAIPISGLVREMASGLVRIALECDKEEEKKSTRLIDEILWRTYCNGKKCGFATRKECGPKELQILKAVEPISMGAGVLPEESGESLDSGDVMYMRAKFERVVGSRDSEAFYMMNPDSDGAPELSIYLLRV
ncbi:protein MIZU-KUSSEI 1-like [Nicotiana tabacum]|uniref:Protein MIZU-KUSSEI 1-like n=2 Tax=Nicotiana TaxID=4085 RepID=A0A1S4BKQ1_TOBAC|nr:PREDICTED: protein MIZU-KUSSEI 1-like [Nicotiana sylvestris]XP_016489473.1 PREDICTED: protein MIZU-KUSSEI 1-like [Nicotiana tabacum]